MAIRNKRRKRRRGKSPSRPGYIYMMYNGDDYKLGLSGNPEDRLEEVNKSTPNTQVELIHYTWVLNMKAAENKLHSLFGDKNVTWKGDGATEWFNLNGLEYLVCLAWFPVLTVVPFFRIAIWSTIIFILGWAYLESVNYQLSIPDAWQQAWQHYTH